MIVLKNILVPTDFGDAADAAIRYGRALARTFGATLHVLHVLDNTFMHATFADPSAIEGAARKQLNDRLTGEDWQQFHARAIVERYDSPSDAIVRYAKSVSIDLIVMGTHGRHGAAHALMGSVAERVVRTAPCPVLVVRHPEHEFIAADDTAESVSA